MPLLSTTPAINVMRPMSWGAACHGRILTLYLALLLVEFHKTKSAAPGALWRWRKWWRQAIHVVATITVITEEQLILLEKFKISKYVLWVTHINKIIMSCNMTLVSSINPLTLWWCRKIKRELHVQLRVLLKYLDLINAIL